MNEELKILNETNEKFYQENQILRSRINEKNLQISDLQKSVDVQNQRITQDNIDKEELEFLRLNLLYSSKCQTRKLFSKGYKVGTQEYKDCILRKGKKIND